MCAEPKGCVNDKRNENTVEEIQLLMIEGSSMEYKEAIEYAAAVDKE